MEISLLCLMECAHSNPKELQSYEAESEGCYEGSVADALKIILHLSLRKHDAMESVGDSFRNLSIQGPKMDEDASFLSPEKPRGSQQDAASTEVCATAPVSIPGTPRKRGAEDEPEPLLVLSPSRRVCGKQREADVPMVYRRNSHYCQAADCVFNRSMPGQPAWATATNCVWCDPDAMARALEGGSTLKNVRLSLSMFEQKDTAVYERAMALLPVGFTRSAESYMLCQNAQCCFSTVTVGGRAYTESPVCLLCDPKTLLVYGTEEHVRKRVNTILNRL